MRISITLELTSLAQVEAVVSALETSIDLEESRKDGDPDWSATDDINLKAARSVLAGIAGSK